jgi:hypothetical protein
MLPLRQHTRAVLDAVSVLQNESKRLVLSSSSCARIHLSVNNVTCITLKGAFKLQITKQKYNEFYLLGYNAMKSVKSSDVPEMWDVAECCFLHGFPRFCTLRRLVPPKSRLTFTGLHAFTCQKT